MIYEPEPRPRIKILLLAISFIIAGIFNTIFLGVIGSMVAPNKLAMFGYSFLLSFSILAGLLIVFAMAWIAKTAPEGIKKPFRQALETIDAINPVSSAITGFIIGIVALSAVTVDAYLPKDASNFIYIALGILTLNQLMKLAHDTEQNEIAFIFGAAPMMIVACSFGAILAVMPPESHTQLLLKMIPTLITAGLPMSIGFYAAIKFILFIQNLIIDTFSEKALMRKAKAC